MKNKEIKDQLDRDIELALSAQQAKRKNAPKGVTAGMVFENPRRNQMLRLVPEAFGKDAKGNVSIGGRGAKESVFFGKARKHRQYLAQGWVPVLDDGEHAQHEGDLMYCRPIVFSRAEQKQAQAISDQRVEGEDAALADNPLVQAFKEHDMPEAAAAEPPPAAPEPEKQE